MNNSASPVIEIDKNHYDPSMTESPQSRTLTISKDAQPVLPDLAVIRQSGSALAESIRAIRTQLLLRGFSSGKKTLAVAGVSRDYGASLFSANLAVLFSLTGKKTLLIDADMRNPSLHRIFNVTSTQGLSDVLANRAVPSEAFISISALPNLTLLPAGAVQPDSSELFSAKVFSDINEKLTGQFDVIFYNVTPPLESTDTLMLTKHLDCVLLVVHKDQSRLADVDAVCKQMTDNGIEIIGSVIVDY